MHESGAEVAAKECVCDVECWVVGVLFGDGGYSYGDGGLGWVLCLYVKGFGVGLGCVVFLWL